MSNQTWTDEQLQACLDALDVQMRNGIKPNFCLSETPARFPLRGMHYFLQHDDTMIALTLPQAQMIEVWLQPHVTPPVKAKHDGKLDSRIDGDFDGEVRLDGRYVRLECLGSQVVLEAKQAISLLSWLEQNRAELTALAEGQVK